MEPSLVNRLDTEWVEISTRPLPDLWVVACELLVRHQTLDEVLLAISANPDCILGFLIGRAQAGDMLAGRVVLQSMLGKLVKMSRTGIAQQTRFAVDDLVTHLWLTIGCYPLDQRPRSIAANLALDSLKAAQREWRAGHNVEVPMPTGEVEDLLDSFEPQDRLTVDALIDAAFKLRLITEPTRDILVAVYGPEELTGAVAAKRWNCTPSAIRSRCRWAVRKYLAPLARELQAA